MDNDYVVVATAQRGGIGNSSMYKSLLVTIYIVLATAMFFVAMSILVVVGVLEGEPDYVVCMLALVAVLVGIVLFVWHLRNKMYNNYLYVDQCMVDAVMCDMYITKMSNFLRENENPRYYISIQYQGETIAVLTAADSDGRTNANWFGRYSNRDIRALYSPQFNDVLLLEQDIAKEIL